MDIVAPPDKNAQKQNPVSKREPMPRQTPRADDHKTKCSVETALSLIGGRWKGVVLFWLLKGKKRFGELRKILSNCSQRMLTVQLRELEEDGLVTRTVFPEVPPRVEYELTEFGRTLEPVLISLKEWGDQYKQKQGAKIDPACIERKAS
jgi:DNA-binding HxlR family transcriptional regulator